MKARQAALSKLKPEADINPNLIEVAERVPIKEEKVKDPFPDAEWWYVPFFYSNLNVSTNLVESEHAIASSHVANIDMIA